MGSSCCSRDEEEYFYKYNHRLNYRTNSNIIMQATQFKLSGKSNIIRMINIYDIENDIGFFSQPCTLLNSFEGLGQLNYKNDLYLCGGNEKIKGGTYFMLYEPKKKLTTLTQLINCLFDHKYPSMTQFMSDYIVVIGGMENNIKCEIYSIFKKKWKELPDLPEGRYGACIYNDQIFNNIYVFGGKCGDSFCCSILKINIMTSVIWETIIVRQNSHLLQISHFALLKVDDNRILFLGGSINGNDLSDSVIEFNLISKIASTSKMKLNKPSKFFISNNVQFRNHLFYFYDNKSLIHIFDKSINGFKKIDLQTNIYDNTETLI